MFVPVGPYAIGSGTSTGGGGGGGIGLPEFITSESTRWVHPFRMTDGSNWALTVNVLVKPFTITVP